MNLKNRSDKGIFSPLCYGLLCQIAIGCTGNMSQNKNIGNNDSSRIVAIANDSSTGKNEKTVNNRQELDQFLGFYKSFCREDSKVYLTLNITKEDAGYIIQLKSFPENYTIIEEIAKPDTINFDKQFDVWSVTDKKNLTYGFVFNKKYLVEFFLGCIVLDNVDKNPTINDCFIQDKQNNIVFCKSKKD